MQEEQRSLSSLETLSVWRLLMDDSVRWQVLSVVVINIGMQLSGIDAVSKSRSSTTRSSRTFEGRRFEFASESQNSFHLGRMN